MQRRGHRKGRLSLPAIRISAPQSPAAEEREPANEPSLTLSSRRLPSRSPLSSSLPLSNRQLLTDYSSDDELDRLPGLKAEHARDIPPDSELANAPIISQDLQQRIAACVASCKEHERKCAQLEHSIEHKILLWADILNKYETQDSTASDVRESVASSLATLNSVQANIESAGHMTSAASAKLANSRKTAEKAHEAIAGSKATLTSLEEYMRHEEVQQGKVESLQRAFLAVFAFVVAVLAVILFWYSKR